MTLREYISFWQETYDKHQSRPTTYAAHNYVFKNHILPGLGDVLLSELTSEMVGEFLEERKRFGNHRPGKPGLGEETMRHIHRLLQQCLDQAIRDGLIAENPAKAFHYRKSTTVKANVMTPLEVEDYLDAAERLDYSLAKLYLSDDLEIRDIRIGMDWLYTAATNGNHYAMYCLAKELLKGDLIEQNTDAAVEWFTRSAERGNQYAQYMLGKLYLTGKEAPHDEEQAVYWLTQSAEQGNQYAEYLLEHLEENRPPSAMLAVTRLLHHMSRIFQDNSVPKSRPGGIQIDRKRLKKLQEKRIALGHKPDDYEEQWPDMTM